MNPRASTEVMTHIGKEQCYRAITDTISETNYSLLAPLQEFTRMNDYRPPVPRPVGELAVRGDQESLGIGMRGFDAGKKPIIR